MAKGTQKKIAHPCLNDGKEIPNWRSNKLFCSDICKYEYHNKKRAILDDDMKHINKILATNYSILKQLIGEKETVEVTYKTLTEMEFDFQFHTQVMGYYHNIYTLSWLKMGNGNYKISKVPRKTYRGGYTIK